MALTKIGIKYSGAREKNKTHIIVVVLQMERKEPEIFEELKRSGQSDRLCAID